MNSRGWRLLMWILVLIVGAGLALFACDGGAGDERGGDDDTDDDTGECDVHDVCDRIDSATGCDDSTPCEFACWDDNCEQGSA